MCRFRMYNSNNKKMVIIRHVKQKQSLGDFPDGTVVKNLPASAGDMGSSPGLGRSHMPQSK